MFSFKKTLPEKVGIPSSCIKELLLYLDKKGIPMHSLLIMRNDKLVLEKYYAPYTADTLHRMFSISKSFTGLAISLLADEGKIDLDESITTYFPEYADINTHKWIKETTIRNMLMMRTCHASTTYKVDMTTNWTQSFFTVAPTHKPGTVFHYDTSAAHVLCALVEKETGMDILDYLKEKVLKYLDFSQESYMIKDPFGTSIGGSGLMALPMDILKVLYLISKNGTVTCSDGVERTLINPDYIIEATSNLSDTVMTGPIPSEACGYGMQIWKNEKNGFVMYGLGGQLAISIPQKDLLIVTTADTQGMAGANQVIYDAIYKMLRYMNDTPVNDISDDNKSSYEAMMEVANFLEISLPRIQNCSYKADSGELPGFIKDLASFTNYPNSSDEDPKDTAFVSLCYFLSDNPKGFDKLHLKLSAEGASTISLSGKTDSFNINFGFNKMQEGLFSKYNNPYTAGAVWLRENVLYIRVHLIGECVGSIAFELYFGEKDITVFMKKIEETYFKEFDGHLYGVFEQN